MDLKPGDTVSAKYTDALGRILAMRGTVDRYDPDFNKWWIKLPIGVSLSFTDEQLTLL